MQQIIECKDGTVVEVNGGTARIVRYATDTSNVRRLEGRVEQLENAIRALREGQR